MGGYGKYEMEITEVREVTKQYQYFCTPCFSIAFICTLLGYNITMDILQHFKKYSKKTNNLKSKTNNHSRDKQETNQYPVHTIQPGKKA